MNELRSTKYMNIFTYIGYFLGFGCILWYIVTQGNAALPLVGVVVIFLMRTIGYGIDRLIELNEDKKKR
ncbi:MAG: hypothetical protein ACLUVC_09890 [Longibaculum sp.]